ncbi:MAG: ATP-binding protein [bacterium]|nr:ATP-binding protein [bacterium]
MASNTIRVLLIDDDRNYYTLTNQMLAHTQQNFVLEWVETYAAGIEKLRQGEYQVYLIDYRLSGEQNGIDLVRAAVAEGINAPMILLTGQGDHDIDLHALKAGAADYIDKAQLKPVLLERSIRYALERDRFIKEVYEGEARYRRLLDEASDGIIIGDNAGRIVYINSTARGMLGYPVAHSLGMLNGAPDLLHTRDLIHPSDPHKAPLDAAQPDSLLSERVLKRANGAPLNVEVSATIIDADRRQFIVRDITPRKQMEAEREKHIQQLTILRQIDDELSQMSSVELVLALALDAAVRLSGADAGFIGLMENNQVWVKQAIGRYTEIALDTPLPESPLIRELIDTQEARFFPAQPGEGPHGQMIFPLNSYERLVGVLNLETHRPERFTQETFDFIKLIATRVAVSTENAQLYKLAQDQLSRLTDLYEQVKGLEQLKTDMIRIAAHDLRNPVSVIVGYTELLRWNLGDNLTQKQEHFLASIERAAKRMEKITTDILSLERIENIQADKRETIDLNAVLTEVFHDYELQAQQKKQQLTLNLPQATLYVEADSAQLREAMANLVSNAIKYTPESGTVTISLAAESGKAVFKVVDTGFGIPDDQKAGLFKPFYRAQSEETATIEGTGLGLHLVKNIVERYDGEMIFTSTYGTGSTFGFRMPGRAVSAEAKVPSPESKVPSTESGASGVEPKAASEK